jgi:hypothetical protein
VNRRGDVLDLLLADVGELHRHFVGHLFIDCARHAQAAGLCQALEACRDIHAVAEQVTVALNHVPDGNANPEVHLPARGIGKIAGAQAFLHVDRAAHGFDRARELRQDRIARGVEDTAGTARDEIVEYGSV